ncbi:hypothetical protein CCP3SC15_330018 [Gammaproteobacteria bacterium]
MKLSEYVALAVASETTYGVPPEDLSTSYLGVICQEAQVAPKSTSIERKFNRRTFTQLAPLQAKQYTEISFSTEIKGVNSSTLPSGEGVLHRLLYAAGFIGKTSPIRWCELANGDNDFEVSPYQSVWLVEDHAGTPVNRPARVVGMVRRKRSAGDTSQNDFLVLEFFGVQPAGTLNKSKTQELYSDSNSAPSSTKIATLATSNGHAIIDMATALAPCGDLALNQANSISLAYFLDDILHLTPGVLGSVSLSLSDAAPFTAKFSFSGLYSQPMYHVAPDIVFNEHQPPPPAPASFSIFSGGVSYAPQLISLEYNHGCEVKIKGDLNLDNGIGGVYIANRKSTFKLSIGVDSIDSFNPWSKWTAGTELTASFVQGYATVGNRVAVLLPKLVITAISYSDKDGETIYNIDAIPTGNDDDEIVIAFG